MKRVAIFVYGSNFFYTQKILGWSIDMLSIKEIIERKEVDENVAV